MSQDLPFWQMKSLQSCGHSKGHKLEPKHNPPAIAWRFTKMALLKIQWKVKHLTQNLDNLGILKHGISTGRLNCNSDFARLCKSSHQKILQWKPWLKNKHTHTEPRREKLNDGWRKIWKNVENCVAVKRELMKYFDWTQAVYFIHSKQDFSSVKACLPGNSYSISGVNSKKCSKICAERFYLSTE